MKKLLLLIAGLWLQGVAIAQKTLNGTIADTTGTTIPGAVVVLKGTSTFAVTNAEGRFKLKLTQEPPYTIVVNATGYKARETVFAAIPDTTTAFRLQNNTNLSEVMITSRRRVETAQDVPIPITVIGGKQIEETGAFNVNRLKELVPSVQLYSSNPRNTALNIRGLGSTYGLTNDGIDPGVGFYVDGVYYARPAAATLDFIDIEQIEVLRGPQGTLFGKNTTAGAFNIITRAPRFKPGADVELSYGNYGYIQAKASVTGPITKKLAGRFSFSGTQRDGTITNITTNQKVNDINNLGGHAQLLYTPNENIKITLSGDATRQRPVGYAQVVAGVVTTQRAAYRQFNNIIADLGYKLPSTNPFDRVIDQNTPSISNNDLGGASLNVDAKLWGGTLTSTTAWRYWNWSPSSDRDFIGLDALRLSQSPAKQQQWSEEVRYAGNISPKLSGVIGVFAINQRVKADPTQVEESGSAQWRFVQSSTSALWKTPGLLDGYGIRTDYNIQSFSAAVFGQLDWSLTDKLHILPGLRLNYDEKNAEYARTTYGGLQTTDAALLALKASVYAAQAYNIKADQTNLSGQLTANYRFSNKINAFATFSTAYKPVGINVSGLPASNGEALLDLARVKPEYTTHYEVGVKTSLAYNFTANVTVHNSDIKDFQTQVQTAEVGVNRGYLANAEKVRVSGAELDLNYSAANNFSLFGSVAYTDAKYVSFKNAPVPLEETGATAAYKDISGTQLPGISKWAASAGGEVHTNGGTLLGWNGSYFVSAEGFYRSSFSSSPSYSKYLNIDGYAIFNARIGFKGKNGTSFYVWGRNLLNTNYFEQLLAASGNSGLYAGVLGDPRTYGVTLHFAIK